MEASKFFKVLAFIYFIVLGSIAIYIWGSGLFWEIIDALSGDSYGFFWSRYHDVIDLSYFTISFSSIFIKASFIYHKGLSLENRSNN